ncbi:LOW QUALITY PROTEIN: hypothetical protein CH63R_10448 [Colletotrichum higginsianum IMI 349063]|uniref:Uncharacterized protein n=1 Tax=Colletotrichum higginsianum (strain IMI 349063) TaxID=759273 RepID=A0A1B7Y2U2_COLHI|nr:LOW QUALITY PROTEIN: uncharacterized protein CH63R_10448 [Colletotrichum higginsianum IMI 349063]OBR06328.1 LOW QUALITY PROTEIN: hypothetical protein CH63R_10448 [Colletotrichum higginsianum IMI 349063]GJD04214.1 hypothetical protein ColKHC_13039 [Colletotrichum higginsianum]
MAGLQPGAGTPLSASSSAPLLGRTGAGTGTPNTLSGATGAQSETGGTNRLITAIIIIIVCAAREAKHADSLTKTDAITTTTTRALELRPPSHHVRHLIDAPALPPSATSLPVVLPSSPPAVLTPSPTPSFIPPPPPVIPESSLPPTTPTPTPTPTPLPGGIASPSQAETSGGGNGVKLMPALPIALGSVGGVLIFGLIIGMLYRKGRWPFHRRRHFAEIDELEVERQQELERQNKMKWDPRVTRAYRTQDAGVNF